MGLRVLARVNALRWQPEAQLTRPEDARRQGQARAPAAWGL